MHCYHATACDHYLDIVSSPLAHLLLLPPPVYPLLRPSKGLLAISPCASWTIHLHWLLQRRGRSAVLLCLQGLNCCPFSARILPSGQAVFARVRDIQDKWVVLSR